jgi:RNA polymerase sigma-70 factor (sigma-E family)
VGDERDFEEYVAARWPVLVRSAVFLGCSMSEAEDLVQSTLLRCFRSWDRVSKAGSRDAYVYRVMLNVLSSSRVRLWRGERPSSDRIDDSASSIDVAETVTTTATLRAALLTLPAEQRSVLVLRYYADLPEHQVADVLGIAVGTVKSRSARALSRLLTVLDDPSSTAGVTKHE